MSFNSISFIFVFFPAALLLYAVVPKPVKNALLVILSLLFYAWGNPADLPVLLFSLAFNYLAAIEIDEWRNRGEEQKSRFAMLTTVAVDLLLLGFYKYTGFLLGIFGISYTGAPLPLGISFFTFSVLSYIFDVYRGTCPAQTNVIRYSLYVALFVKITSGPIVEYNQMADQLEDRKITMTSFGSGLSMFLMGLFKKVLLADNLSAAFSGVYGSGEMAAATAWLGMIFYSLQLYFDFSGYSDMAIGLGRMLGFKFGKNFDYPYLADGPSDFWRRWHISLGRWFRDYVYIPLGGNRCSKSRQLMNLSVVWLLTGIWHGASWNYIIWGIYHGFFVIFEKFVLGRHRELIPRPVRTGATVLIAFIGWIFFFCPGLEDSFRWIGTMFGAGAGIWNHVTTYYLTSNLLLLVLAVLFCTPYPRRLAETFAWKRSKAISGASVAVYLLLFILCVSNMIANTYSSFLYFQF
jgi:alginate O-acetyltransferase complex protein AlgI